MTSCCRLVALLGNPPVFIRAERLHDQLFARELVCTPQVFTYKVPNQCALNVIAKAASAFVNLISAIGGFVAASRA